LSGVVFVHAGRGRADENIVQAKRDGFHACRQRMAMLGRMQRMTRIPELREATTSRIGSLRGRRSWHTHTEPEPPRRTLVLHAPLELDEDWLAC
jgi:hypothetical protein